MRYLNVIKQDDIFQLRGVAYYGAIPYYGAASYECAVPDLSVFTDDNRPVEIRGRKNNGGLGRPNIFLDLLVFILRQRRAQGQNKFLNMRKSFPGILKTVSSVSAWV